ncbi:hypothetical protein [Lysinibacillus xylanilyticus]|uniref:hypothetical protein n=1 Tax=Lysinibacillus xylanilyticus TaxID=582475 RepID=UPI003D070E5A
MNDIKTKIDRLLSLYLDGVWSKEQLNTQKTLLENELKLHEERFKQITNKQELIKANLFNYDVVMQYLSVAERFDTLLEKSEQMEMIGHLFPTATVYEDKIIFNILLPNNVPLDISVPIAPDPYKRAKIISSGVDPQGKYNRIQQYLKDNPGATVKAAADALKIPTSTAFRLEKKLGKFERIDF